MMQLAGAASLCASPGFGQVLRTGEKDSPLRVLASQRGIVFGCAANSFQLRDADFAAVLAREAGILVPEYEMKRGVIEAARGSYDFSGVDALLGFARKHDMALRGHPLVWHKRNPDWLEAAVASERNPKLVTDYIANVTRHYKGHVNSWDVVNEAIKPEDGRADGLRNTLWLQAFGPTYIDIAYHTAREADPSALLVYNDWGCEAGAPDNDRFRRVTLDFLERARARGVPIGAYGMQGHLAAYGAQVDQRKLREFLARLQSMGLKILVTEHDVDDSGGASDEGARDRAVADASRRFLDVVLDNSATVAVLTWGLSDRFLDPPGWRARLAGYSPRMLPLDPDLQRKAMWHAMARAFAPG
jgi:endo-1,4-beta-xylanase